MERTKLGLSKDKMYKALGEGERTSKKVSSIRMSDGSTFKRKNANQYGAAEGGNDYTEKRSNRTDRFDLGGTADSSNTGANMGGTMGSSVMKHGGEIKENNRMYNFLKDDLVGLEAATKEMPFSKEEIERFFSYWGTHLKSLKTKTNDRMYNFLKDDLKKLEKAINDNNTEEIDIFFSYWNRHIESLKMKKGGNLIGKQKKRGSGTKSEISHYKVNGHIFIDYMDAIDYCDKNKLSYSKIIKTKTYAQGGLSDLPENPNNDAISYKNGGGVIEEGDIVLVKSSKLKGEVRNKGTDFVTIEYIGKRPSGGDKRGTFKLNELKLVSEYANGGGLANTPESFPSNDAVSYKTGGRIKKITEWSISTNNEDEHFDNYKDAKNFWNNLDKKEKETGQFFKKSYINGEEDDVEILDGKLSGYANGGTTKSFEYTIGGL